MRYNLLNELTKYFHIKTYKEMKVVEWETNMLRGLLDYFTNKNQVDIRAVYKTRTDEIMNQFFQRLEKSSHTIFKNQVDIKERHCDLKTCCVTESSTSNVKLGGKLPVA